MIKPHKFLAALIGASITLTACTPKTPATPIPPQTNKPPVKTVLSPQAHTDIITIIRAGDAAMASKNAQGLMDAAHLLAQFGARPLSAHSAADDLVQFWDDEASILQATTARPAYRGRVRGPAYRKHVLAPGGTETLEEIYYASENALLTFDTVSGGSLDVVVSEQISTGAKSADAVCHFSTGAKPVSCQWLPLWTAKYNILITNNTQTAVPYLLVTN